MSFESLKSFIFLKAINSKSHKYSIQFLVFDNMNATENLRNKPTITFNYLMYLKQQLITSHEKL